MSIEEEWQRITAAEKSGTLPATYERWGVFPLSSEPERVFFFPDIHFPFQDVAFLDYLTAKCRELNPTTIVILGDVLDCYSVSDFDKDPGRKETINDERNAAVNWLRKLRSMNPQSEIIFIEGNHEERIRRNINRYMPGLFDLPELSIPALLRLPQLDIAHFNSFGFVRWGMRIKHGESTAKWSSNAEMLKHRIDGVSGHVHRKQEASFTDGEGRRTVWRAIGHCCDLSHVDYAKGMNWQLCGGQMIVPPGGEPEFTYLEG